MARKHTVLCLDCGKEFDANEPGTLYIKKSRRYVCPHCAQQRSQRKQASPTTYKVSGIIACICGVLIGLMGLLMVLALPGIGIIATLSGIGFFILGKKYIAMSKDMVEKQNKIV